MAEGKGKLFSIADFRNFFGLSITSRSATSVLSLVIVWYVFTVTKSALDVAIVGITETVSAVIISLPAGVWVDRYNRLGLLVISNAIRTAAAASLAIFSILYGFNFILTIAAIFVWNSASELYRSSHYSSLPELIDKEYLASANGIIRTGQSLLNSASTVIGGTLIVLIGVSIALSYGAAGYAISLIFSILLLRTAGKRNVKKNETTPVSGRGLSEILRGFSWLWTQKGLLLLSISALCFNFYFTVSYYFLVVYVESGIHAGALIFALVLAAYSIGYSIGSPLLGYAKTALRYAGRIWALMYGGAIGSVIILMGIFPISEVAISLTFIMGLAIGFSGNVWLTSAQNIVPVSMRGRYFAIDGLLSFLGGPPAVAVGGVMVILLGVIHTFELSGIILLILAVVFSSFKSLWNLDGTKSPETSV